VEGIINPVTNQKFWKRQHCGQKRKRSEQNQGHSKPFAANKKTIA
jgi:hypothetical protein